MRNPCLLSLVILTCAVTMTGTGLANIPDPAESIVPNVVVSPDGTLEYVVTVIANGIPWENGLVQILFSPEAAAAMCWCDTQSHPLLDAITNTNGEASFFIAAGGCIDPSVVLFPPAAEVFASGIKIGEAGVVSPDIVDSAGLRATDGWNPGGVCTVGLPDAVSHTSPISAGTYSFCTDLDSDLSVTVVDAVLVTAPIAASSGCIQSP